MKIAFISMIRDSWGGSEELWYEVAKEALREGHEILHSAFYCGSVHPKTKELKEKGVRIFYRRGFIPANTSDRKKLMLQSLNFLTNKINNPFGPLFSHQPDMVIYTGTAYSIAKEKHLLRYLREPRLKFNLIIQLNAENKREITEDDAARIREAYSRCDNVFFVSEKNLKVAEHHLCTDIPNARVVRNPVNISSVEAVSYPEEKVPQFAMVGNLNTLHKGQDILLSVIAKPEWRSRDFCLNIYGKGPDEDYLKKLTEYYKLSNKVIFQGTTNDIRKLWQKNHMILLPSHIEGMPLVVVEAMLCGRPAVVSDSGGTTEWIEEGQSGFIAEAATTASFANAMERAWQRKGDWQSMGLNARQRAIKLYDPNPGKTLLQAILK